MGNDVQERLAAMERECARMNAELARNLDALGALDDVTLAVPTSCLDEIDAVCAPARALFHDVRAVRA